MEDGRDNTHQAHCITKLKTLSLHHPLGHHLLTSLSFPQLPCFKLKTIKNSRVATQFQPVHGGITHHGHGHPQCSMQDVNTSAPSQRKGCSWRSDFHPIPSGPVWPKLPCSHKNSNNSKRGWAWRWRGGRHGNTPDLRSLSPTPDLGSLSPPCNKRRNPLTTNAIRLFTVDSQRKQLQRNCIVFHIAMVIFFTRSTFLDKI